MMGRLEGLKEFQGFPCSVCGTLVTECPCCGSEIIVTLTAYTETFGTSPEDPPACGQCRWYQAYRWPESACGLCTKRTPPQRRWGGKRACAQFEHYEKGCPDQDEGE